MSLFCNKTLRDSLQELMENLSSMSLVFTPSVGVEYFWVDLDEGHVFVPTPSVGVVHIWVVCTQS
jgi:hypothetical protein